jgi:hypothetical protein
MPLGMLLEQGVVYLVTTLSMAFIPVMKEMNRKEPVNTGIT